MNARMIVVGVVGLAVVAGAVPAKRYAARISVKGELEKDRDSSKNESANSSTKTKSEVQFYNLEVTVANTGKHTGTFDLEWYFLKRRLDAAGKKGDPVLSEKDKTTLTIAGMKRVVHPVTSSSLSWSESKSSKNSSGRNNNSSSSSKKNISGEIYGGYVLLLRADGEMVAKYASDRKFLSDEWLVQLQAPVANTTPARKTKNKKRKKKKK
ncbi:hypothetical protein P4B35_18115 [Pontiellaceae bacterium B12227]|nr:hypothetical protein [Pontiellaceae bacterium B12227]